MEKDESLKFSKHVRFHTLNKDEYIGWNRFFPSVLKLNRNAVLFLKNLNNKKGNTKNIDEKDELLKYRFIYKGDFDPYNDQFFKKVDEEFRLINQKANEFYRQKLEYAQLYIYNEYCNLKCPYCIRNYKRKRYPSAIDFDEKKRILYHVVDQYFERKIKAGLKLINVSFNGGEILLEWELMKSLVERNSKKYNDVKIKYYINTNLTLMTEEIAKFMSKYDFDLDISIDGYQDAHNKTRFYNNRKESFDDVIRGLEIYRKYNEKDPINDFQGTIENPDTFSSKEVFKMSRFGFKNARLAPNLLNVTEQDVKKKVKIMAKLLNLNSKNTFQVNDSYFNNIRDLINLDEYKFYFSCNGLSCLPRMGFHVNISSIRFSHICDYVSKASLPAKDLNYDIYNPNLWKITRNFIRERINSLKKNCKECDLIGICKGDCVMLGLDNENQLNKAACLYQSEMWKLFLNHIYKNELKMAEIVNKR
jgi:uncharacterized protein